MDRILHVLDVSIPKGSGYSSRSKYILEFQKKLGYLPTGLTSPKHKSESLKETIDGITYYRSSISKNSLNHFLLRFLISEKT
jgi:glycogen synthase